MSKIKEEYHDIICEGQRQAMEDADLDRQYESWLETKEAEIVAEEDDFIKIMAAKEEFINIFEKTGTYPL